MINSAPVSSFCSCWAVVGRRWCLGVNYHPSYRWVTFDQWVGQYASSFSLASHFLHTCLRGNIYNAKPSCKPGPFQPYNLSLPFERKLPSITGNWACIVYVLHNGRIVVKFIFRLMTALSLHNFLMFVYGKQMKTDKIQHTSQSSLEIVISYRNKSFFFFQLYWRSLMPKACLKQHDRNNVTNKSHKII